MSKTFTSRPSVASRARGSNRGPGNQTNTRGRGRGTAQTPSVRGSQVSSSTSRTSGLSRGSQTSRGGMDGFGARPRGRGTGMYPPTRGPPPVHGGEEVGATGGASQSQSPEQRMSHQGAYTMVTPNQRKRQQISDQAQRETEEYERFKAENKPQHVSYHGTVGGGQMSEAQARQKMAQTNAKAKYSLLEKQRQQREEKRRHDETGFERKKMDARKKTEENERRALREQDRKREEMERIKNNFLDRFEKSAPKASSSQSQPISQATPPRSQPTNQRRWNQTSPPMRTEYSEPAPAMNSDLQTLISMFPQYSPEAIAEIYSANNSLEMTASILSDS